LNSLKRWYCSIADLREYNDRWGRIYYCSKSVNALCADFDWRNSCGCCSDAAIVVWPYIETTSCKIYSDPPNFTIGSKDRPEPIQDWEQSLKNALIPEVVVERIAKMFPLNVD
jgi:hypothetical protein